VRNGSSRRAPLAHTELRRSAPHHANGHRCAQDTIDLEKRGVRRKDVAAEGFRWNESPTGALTHAAGAACCARDGVSSPVELRSYAVDCARLARSASDPHDKARLLNMARAWTELADCVEKIGLAGTTAANSAPQPDVPLPGAPAPELPIVENGESAPPSPPASA
jgi:hypothetical protein